MSKGSDSLLKIGVIGAGVRGVLDFVMMLVDRNDARLTAIADPNGVRSRKAADLLDTGVKCYSSAVDMLDAETLDGVIITSPDYTHEENALAAIERGVNILVDKPLATTSAGCMRIIKAAREKNVVLSVGFNLRCLPVIRKVKELIDNGEIGNVMLIENREFYNGGRTYMARWNRRYKWSGGLWVHKGSHDFDIFNWWNSSGTPIRVSSFAGVNAFNMRGIPFVVDPDIPVGPYCAACGYKDMCPDYSPPIPIGPPLFAEDAMKVDHYARDLCIFTSDKDVFDNGVAIVEYDNNTRASHIECFVCNFEDRIYTVIGDKGIITASLTNPSSVVLKPRWGKEDRLIHVPPAGDGGHGGADPFIAAGFLKSIRDGSVNLATGTDGVRSVAIGEAAEISWREHRMVEIDEVANLYDPILVERDYVRGGSQHREDLVLQSIV